MLNLIYDLYTYLFTRKIFNKLNKSIFYLSLRVLGVLNYKSDQVFINLTLLILRAAIGRMANIGITLKPQMTFSILDYIKLRLVMLFQRLWLFNTNFVSRL